MGTQFDDIANKALSVLFSPTIASSVTYNRKLIPAHIRYLADPDERHATASRASAELDVRASDVSSPKPYDSVVIGGETWTVVSVIDGSGYDWTLAIETDVRKSGKGR